MYQKKEKNPGSECVKNPFTTWRPTKKMVSASQSDTRAPLRWTRLQHHMLSPPLPARLPTHSAPPQVCPHPCLTLHPENEAWKPGPGAAYVNHLGVSLIDVCQIIQAKKKGKMLPNPPLHL